MNTDNSKSISSCGWTETSVGESHWRVRAAVTALLAILGSAALTGCIIIPVDYHAKGSRHNVTMSVTNELRAGTTTREEVILTLGEPDFISEDEQRFGYFWSKVKAILIVASYGSGSAAEIPRSYLIEVTFDQRNRVSKVRATKRWGDAVTGDPDVPESGEDVPRRKSGPANVATGRHQT